MKALSKTEAIRKINIYGKIGKIFITIGIVVAGIMAFTTLIAAIAVNCIPQNLINLTVNGGVEAVIDTQEIPESASDAQVDLIVDAINNENSNAGVNLGAISFELNEAYADGGVIHASSGIGSKTFTLKSLSGLMIASVITSIFTIVTLVFGRMLCKAFQLCSTPFEDNVIKKIRYFAFSLIPWAIVSKLPEGVANAMFSQGVKISNINMDVVYIVLVVLALSMVFKYGAMLQQESDETL